MGLDEGHLNNCTKLSLRSFDLVRLAICELASMHVQGLTAVCRPLTWDFKPPSGF